MSAALITLREGLEAALIVGIILAYLRRTGHRAWFRHVWIGVAAAIVVAAALGGALFFTVGELEGRPEQLFEGFTMLSAVAVLTWMIFWMRRQSLRLRGSLESKVGTAVAAGSALGLALVAFISVAREGWETAPFLFAVGETSSPAATAVGAVLGLVLAIAIGVGIYRGSRRVDLRRFFRGTGLLLIVFAAGLAAHGTHELQEAGLLPDTVERVWSTAHIVSDGSTLGGFLSSLFGYASEPTLLQVAVWVVFMAAVLTAFLRPPRSTGRADGSGTPQTA